MKKVIVNNSIYEIEKVINISELRAELYSYMYNDDIEIILEKIANGQKDFYFDNFDLKII